MATGTAQKRYETLKPDRQPFLDRARECSKYTLPALLPPEGHTGSSSLEDTYQSFGSRGVNSLASKLLMALMPPNQPFFRLGISEHELAKMNSSNERAQVEEALAKIERTVQHEVEHRSIRVSGYEAIRHLLVSGNVLLFVDPNGGVKLWHLDSFVAERDGKGSVLEMVTHDEVSAAALDEDVIEETGLDRTEDSVDVYTHIIRKPKQWYVYEEINGIKVTGTEAQYPLDKLPYIPLRWSTIHGESYGRGYVEEYLGDLKSLEGLAKATVEGAAAASKVLFLVNSGGKTRVRTIAEAPNLAVRQGSADDVSVLRVEKANDFNFALQMMDAIQQRLAHSFLLTEVVQRDAERVTAHEIRTMAQQLEDALGGVYSVLSEEMQLPLVRVLLHQLQRSGRIQSLPDGTVTPKIVAGMEALGRGHDLNRLQQLVEAAAQMGEQALSEYINVGDYLTRVATSLGIDASGLVRSEQEVQQMREQQAEQEAMARAMEQGIAEDSAPQGQPQQ